MKTVYIRVNGNRPLSNYHERCFTRNTILQTLLQRDFAQPNLSLESNYGFAAVRYVLNTVKFYFTTYFTINTP